ncbi:hypothetical protein E6C67_23495 [Azospirillum sp. TSA2s]|uniref:deoxycytidylate deaminase n=1 Tax=Azospirillum sp. TSA2s TaxID=709810 RepID=UPI0010AB09D9|nr:hypothetical protein [Azospirillum sp. TSA2s]QCG96801.1 hypothetical protein E6C67_23495 [Azospirillum sp. TSA2s]
MPPDESSSQGNARNPAATHASATVPDLPPPPPGPNSDSTASTSTDSEAAAFDPRLLEGFPENSAKRQANRYAHDWKRLAKWDRRYIELAAHIASWSKDPNAKVGCVIVSPVYGRAVTFSFNGFPANVLDKIERLQDGDEKLPRILHAEQNALLYAGREARDCHAYVVGKPVCNICATLLIQAGIQRVVAVAPRAEGTYTPPPKTKTDWDKLGRMAVQMFDEAGVAFVPISSDLSKSLIGKYGLDPNNMEPGQRCSCCEHHDSNRTADPQSTTAATTDEPCIPAPLDDAAAQDSDPNRSGEDDIDPTT